jgi:molybdopterin synthase sulfur carrier subunit
MITINLKLFSIIRYTLGTSNLKLRVEDGITTNEIINKIKMKNWKKLGSLPIRIAVNQAYVDDNFILHNQDDVALIPPVSGG